MEANRRKKVLVVNQDTEFLQYLANFIPLLGNYEIEEAPHLIAGLAKTNAFTPELLIYNLDLTQARARDIFLAELKKKNPDTKMLVVVSDQDEKSKVAEIGFNHILVKPFDLTDLSVEIKKLLPAKNEQQTEYARLLIADDEPEIGEFLSDTFSSVGVQVFTAKDGLDAVKIFREHLCNLALLDVKMPYLGGLEVIKEFSTGSNPPPKDIILMTAALGDSLPELRRLGGYLVLEKPLNIAALEEKILSDCDKFNLSLKKSSVTPRLK